MVVWVAQTVAFIALISASLFAGNDRFQPSPRQSLALALAFVTGAVLARRVRPVIHSWFGQAVLTMLVVWSVVLATRSATYFVALLLGAFACGMAATLVDWGSARSRVRRSTAALVLGIAVGVVVFILARPSPAVAAALTGLIAALSVALDSEPESSNGHALLALPWLGGVLLVLGFVGATNPRSSWLGPITSHGPRDMPRVALTFDDGPNQGQTLLLARLMDLHGVKGTFFVVGKAVEREPGVLAQLVAMGHLIGNHSFTHDGWGYLLPTYPDLARGERAIALATRLCPRYYRPPHGTHTPFVALAAHRHHARVVNWDVSAHDWDATDPTELARRIVSRAHPGSIILLHDGLDGAPGVDRTVLTLALPAIIEGLRAKGLDPVRLDELLGDRPYNSGC